MYLINELKLQQTIVENGIQGSTGNFRPAVDIEIDKPL
jgi:hypothetical protein